MCVRRLWTRLPLLVAVLGGCRLAPPIAPLTAPAGAEAVASPQAPPTPVSTPAVAMTPPRPTSTPAPLVGYRRKGVPGSILTADTLPAGFLVRGVQAASDAEGGLWYVTAPPGQALVHLDAEGRERGRWPVPDIVDRGAFGRRVVRPGLGVFTLREVAQPPMPSSSAPFVPDRPRVPTDADFGASALTFTPVDGRPGWTERVVGSLYNAWLSPAGDRLWFHVVAIAGSMNRSRIEARRLDGSLAARFERPSAAILGMRRDGVAVAYEPATILLLGPDGEVLFEAPRGLEGTGAENALPVVDAQDRVWWWNERGELMRLDPGAKTAVVTSGLPPERAPHPDQAEFAGVTTPDGGRWEQASYADEEAGVWAAIALNGPDARARIAFPVFQHVYPVGKAGTKLWVRGSHDGELYYGLIDPTAPGPWASPGPAEVPDFPPSRPELVGRWQHVREDAPPGDFKDRCPEGRRPAFEFKTGPAGLVVAAYPDSLVEVAVRLENGLVTARSDDPAAPSFTLRHDPQTGHLVGRDARGRPLRLARARGQTCEDPHH